MDNDSLKSMRILFRAHQAIETFSKKDILKYGLNLNEFAALEVLYQKGRLPVQSICDEVLIANSSMTYVLDKLENKLLITRTQDQKDKRTTYIQLSKLGKKFADDVFPNHYKEMRKIFDVLTKEEQEVLNNSLKKIGYFAKESNGN